MTWRTVPSAFSTMLVQASERRSSCGRPRRMTVRISSSPSRMLPMEINGPRERDARFLMLQTPDQVAQEPLGLVCVVLVPGLTERLLDARVQMLGQALDDVTALVDLAALDGGGHTEGVSDRFAECLRAIDDEQPRQCRIEPPGEEIVDQGLDDDRVLRRPLDHGQDMLVAVAIDADRRHQDSDNLDGPHGGDVGPRTRSWRPPPSSRPRPRPRPEDKTDPR